MSEKIHIFDTTLRDGEQSAGVAFTPAEKLEIAEQLAAMGVDVIEAGFPCSSPGDLEAVKMISARVDATVCALARAVKSDIDTAWEGVRGSASPRIHVFINTSDIQIAHQLRKGREEVLAQAEAMVRHAASYVSDVEFSPMDATRSDRGFLCAIIERCIAAGATVINVPDSVGYAIPDEVHGLFEHIRRTVPNIDRARLSFHGQNDLGLCTANTLSAIRGGARQVEVTINGIGERAGNTSLEEVVMAIKTRADLLDVHTDIDTRQIYRISKTVERYSGMAIQHNKAIVGKNAFRHGSGIHQDGILKMRETWEVMDPREIGIPDGTQLVLGKLSGRHAFRVHLAELGYALDDDALDRVFTTFKALADRKVKVDDRDLAAIVADESGELRHPAWRLEKVQVTSSDDRLATAMIRVQDPAGSSHQDAATGDGPIDAVCRAVNRVTRLSPTMIDYGVAGVTEGIDAQGEVTIRLEDEGRVSVGRASDTDIVVASARAYVNAINRLTAGVHRAHAG